jgi:hypothetical protein
MYRANYDITNDVENADLSTVIDTVIQHSTDSGTPIWRMSYKFEKQVDGVWRQIDATDTDDSNLIKTKLSAAAG